MYYNQSTQHTRSNLLLQVNPSESASNFLNKNSSSISYSCLNSAIITPKKYMESMKTIKHSLLKPVTKCKKTHCNSVLFEYHSNFDEINKEIIPNEDIENNKNYKEFMNQSVRFHNIINKNNIKYQKVLPYISKLKQNKKEKENGLYDKVLSNVVKKNKKKIFVDNKLNIMNVDNEEQLKMKIDKKNEMLMRKNKILYIKKRPIESRETQKTINEIKEKLMFMQGFSNYYFPRMMANKVGVKKDTGSCVRYKTPSQIRDYYVKKNNKNLSDILYRSIIIQKI